MIVSGTDTLSFNDAVAGGFLSSSAIYNWDSQTTSYVSNDALKTWNGQCIASNVDNIELLVPPIFADNTTTAARQMIVPTPDNWEIIIEVETDDLADRITKLGVLESATDGFDPQFDYPEPPSPPGGQFIEAYFPHDDWSTILGSKYNFDIRAPLEEGEDATWYIEINGSGTRPITLIWGDMSSLLPPDYSAWLYIPSLFSAVNMFDVTSEEITLELPDNIYIIISTQYLSLSDILGLPTEFALHHNYPNPFNPVTTLRYDLPEQANVNIIIYDLLGREVRTLVNTTQDAGFKSVIWDATNDYGKPVSAGVYLYKIRAGEFVQTKKMVLLK